MIEFKLKDRRLRLIDGVFYVRAISRLGIETINERWREISFYNSHEHLQCGLTCDRVNRRLFQHRMVWYAHHQEWDIWDNSTDNQIDHKNNIRTDNRLCNLRKATNAENAQNREAAGVGQMKGSKKWRARIMIDYKEKHIGTYDTEEEAREAYLAEKRILHPYFVENEEI